MKWTSLNKPGDTVHVHNLTENNAVKETLRFNPLQQSARVTFTDRQSLFFIEQAGFRNNHFIFKNEYGFDLGKFTIDIQHGNNGTIEFEERKLQFILNDVPAPELVIYQQFGIEPVAICELQQPGQEKAVLKTKQAICEFACLLLGLCWHLYKPSAQQTGIGHQKEFLMA